MRRAGCTKLPSFNFPGVTPAARCGTHREDGMVNVRHRCAWQPFPLFGTHGSSKQVSPGMASICLRRVKRPLQQLRASTADGFGTVSVRLGHTCGSQTVCCSFGSASVTSHELAVRRTWVACLLRGVPLKRVQSTGFANPSSAQYYGRFCAEQAMLLRPAAADCAIRGAARRPSTGVANPTSAAHLWDAQG